MNKAHHIKADHIINLAFENLMAIVPLRIDILGYEQVVLQTQHYKRRADAIIHLHLYDYSVEFEIEIKTEVRAHHLHNIVDVFRSSQHPFLLVAQKIYPAQKSELRKMGINYLDVSGNCYIHYKSIFISINGQKDNEQQSRNKTFSKSGLKVIFLFLTNNEAINLTYRQIAEASGVSLGSITAIVESLQKDGYIIDVNSKEKKLNRKQDLLAEWINGYHSILKPSLFLGQYKVAQEKLGDWLEQKNEPTISRVWGGETAAEKLDQWIRAEHLTVYTKESDAEMRRELQLIKRDGGNLSIYEKFWTDTNWDAKHLAPPLLIYADLTDSDDPRNLEAAKRIYDKYLRDE